MAGKNMSSQRLVWWILPAGLAAVVLLAAAAYAAYVFLSYSRIEDNVELEVTGDARSPVQTGREYTAVSYNIDCTYVQNIDTGYQYTDHNPVVLKFILKDH